MPVLTRLIPSPVVVAYYATNDCTGTPTPADTRMLIGLSALGGVWGPGFDLIDEDETPTDIIYRPFGEIDPFENCLEEFEFEPPAEFDVLAGGSITIIPHFPS